jgi:hypothetical protein
VLSFSINSELRKLADGYKDIFSGSLGSFNNICALLSIYLLGFRSLSQLVRACPWTHSVSDLSRSVSKFPANRFMRRYRSSVLNRYRSSGISPDDFCYVIDDTDNPKYGKTVFRQGVWHGSKGLYRGQKVLVIGLVDIKRGICIPLGYKFAIKNTDNDYKPMWALGLALLEEILGSGFPKLYMAADSWFDGREFIEGLRKLDCHFTGELKGNRNVRTNPGINCLWVKIAKLFQGQKRELLTSPNLKHLRKNGGKKKYGTTKYLMISEYSRMLVCVAVFSRRNGAQVVGYYASTDLSLSGSRLWELSRARWKIECMFRDLKQFLSFGKMHAGGEHAADLAVCMPFALFTHLHFNKPNKAGKIIKPTLGNIVQAIREDELFRSIDFIVAVPQHQKVLKLKARRSKIHRKPTDTIAETICNRETLEAA